ncbi:unnamed protein product [Mucor hiemalis]
MSSANRIKLITFDAYNTLFKPKGSLSAQYVEEASKYGLKVTREQINTHFGQAYKQQLLKAPFYGLSLGMTPQLWWKELVYSTFIRSGINQKELDPNFDELYEALYTRFTTAEAYAIFPDVVKTLQELKEQGFQMGVISNSDERVVKVIENLKLSKYFDFVIASSLAKCEKPNKAIYDQALKLTGKGVRAEDALHVGDDVDKDYFGATSAGWNAVLLERTKLSYEEFSPAMIADSSIPCHRPKKILTMRDLYPYVNTLHGDNHIISSRGEDDSHKQSLHASH